MNVSGTSLIIGSKVGQWTVLSIPFKKRGRDFYTCVCSCGEVHEVVGYSLTRKDPSKSCATCANEKKVLPSILGRTFGEWTVISYSRTDKRHLTWNCRCSCGNIAEVRGSDLRLGVSTKCSECGSIKGSKKARYNDSKKAIGDLYCLECGDFIKIGYSKDVPKRVKGMLVSNPFRISILWIIEGASYIEEAWHTKLTQLGLHHRGEWFRRPEDMNILDPKSISF